MGAASEAEIRPWEKTEVTFRENSELKYRYPYRLCGALQFDFRAVSRTGIYNQ